MQELRQIQEQILEKCPEELFTLIMRRCMMRAAEQIGCSAKELYENVRVPTAEESFARVEIFAQSRRRMAISARLFAEYVQDVARGYFAAEDRATPLFPLELGYDLSAEMTPLLCVPVLEREFGLAHSFERAI